jgi:fructose-bisphosphate aldolase class II
MIVNPRELIRDAAKNRYALAGINATTYEGLNAVLAAAEELGAPVMLSHAQVHEPFAPIDTFGRLMAERARAAKIPVILHLDHGTSCAYLIRAIRSGFTSIMYDCAELPVEENIRRLRDFTEQAHALGLAVEGEVGVMPSNIKGQGGCAETGAPVENIEQYYTDPQTAADFVEATAVDMLTISFGTVHGFFVEKPVLDIERVKKIHALTDVGLVMHGTTGVDDAQIIDAINAGICKFNYFTGVGTSANEGIVRYIEEAENPVYYHEIAGLAQELMKARVKKVIELMLNRG